MPNVPPLADAADRSIHYEQVKQAIPLWLGDASAARINALKTIEVKTLDWDKNASAVTRQNLKSAMQSFWNVQNDVDRALSDLQDIYAFAKPLLQQALKAHHGVEDDVEETWLRLYAPVNKSWWAHDFSDGKTSRTVSLLDAALHNFSRDEIYTHDSEFITRPDARGHFAIKSIKHRLSIEQFQSLCRKLDIGAQYERHLKQFLLSGNRLARNVLRHKINASQKSALNVAAHMALMKKDISQEAYDLVQGMLDDRADMKWQGQSVGYYNLTMMDTTLIGIVVITGKLSASSGPVPLIAYVPHDPEHPLKQYSSSLEFMAELTRQLRNTKPGASYQQFFSQFVAHEQRGHFFAGLNERLNKVKWQQAAPGGNLPSWRETPVEHPDLQFRVSSIEEDRETRFNADLWGYFYRQKLNRIFNNAREIAIATEYADRMARWAWWDNLEKMLSDIFNLALLVATPFVPGVGELMLVYTALQLTEEVVEGVVDLAEGRLAEAGAQVMGVLESVVQLGAFAAGARLASVARVKLSPFFESLKPVQSIDGRTRLWNPDLAPYRQPDLQLAQDTRPDTQGIFQHQQRRILRLDDQHFEVKADPVTGQYRIRHPQRADAYTPIVKHNGHGSWVSETENPREWDGTTLLRRLGHATDAFSDTQLEQIRQISGTEEAVLRRMHMENTPPPELLTDTLQRLGSPATVPAAPSPDITALFRDFPDLPESIAQKIIANASPSERLQIEHHSRLSLRLQGHARELQFETQSGRASHGLFNDSLVHIDSERLAFGALRRHTDMFRDLRMEVRQGTVDGELRCTAGPQDAARVRILIRDEAGKYAVRDPANKPIHESDSFPQALLHAMGEQGQKSLGYGLGEVEFFRQWLLAKTAPPGERRTVLATPPIRAVAEHETLQLVRGGALSRYGITLHERAQDLYPHFSGHEVDVFSEALIERGEALKAIEQHENDLDELRVILKRWKYQQPESWGPDSKGFINGGGDLITESLINCFERKHSDLGKRTNPDTYVLDLSVEMLPVDLELWWSKRPGLQKFLDLVTVLKLDRSKFSAGPNGLLKSFPRLRELSANGCELTRLPDGIRTMHQLEHLRLSSNQIVLDATAVEQLRNLTFLEILKLDDNPLALSPDIARMPRLKVVTLKNTGLTAWPEGTLAKPRPRGFHLDLRGNSLESIPDVVPGSAQAWVVARTRVDVGSLSDLNQVLYQQVRHSVNLPPEPLIPSGGEVAAMTDSPFFTSRWNDVPGWGIDRANLWSALIDEPKAARFMTELVNTQFSADYRAGGEAREQLQQRVWRMLDAVQIDTRLREKLFTMAAAPVDCADAGAQLFNHMGINVLASEAYSYSTDLVQLQHKLVTLTKGAARLELVNDIARADMNSRAGNPDEVEVYLAYQTGLAQRLNLPWQSERMLYRGVSGVSDTMIEQAYDTVLALEEGDGLVNKMLEQDYWQDYLLETWPVRMESNKLKYQNKYDQLETVRTTQREWTESATLDDQQRSALKDRLTAQIVDLPIPQSLVFTDQPISDSTFDRLLEDLGYDEKELSRNLTRTALGKAGM
jgi:hypothetical protein